MKTINKHKTNRWLLTGSLGFILVLCSLTLSAQTTEDISRDYQLSINFFSFEPDNPMETYDWFGSGTSTTSGSVGLGCYDGVRSFHVIIAANKKDKRFFANIKIKPRESDTLTEPDSFEVELPDLKARSLELARNEDGRVYMLNLTPEIEIVDNTPKRANDDTFRFDKWTLGESMVIIDDQYYVGRHGCSGGPLAYINVQGLGKVEFALKPFRNAKPLGTLKEGLLHIELEDGTTVDIYNAKNGTDPTELPGGPYQVWVRRQPPEETAPFPDEDEWLEEIKAKADEAGIELPADEEIRKKYQEMKNKKYPSLGSGVGPIKDEDRIE